MSQALILLENGNVLGVWSSTDLPREGDVIQLDSVKFYRVTTLVWVTAREAANHSIPPILYMSRLVRIFVEDMGTDDLYILSKALQKVESQGL